ncbi:hypothetical protein J3T92_01660 [Bifidobacterium sp. B4081]|uniref:hypothetical protein n=1 Tax=unclassified Bifidobacterium TaxID=2608897 RepID=UPI00226AE5A6|nr:MULTISPECIES: hypothetical protein [unclassified Bifidobacterium]MCX8644234.1 hypothetical protein [Bifidobacterium sp. B4077]MCX8645322.1 hypothetical protein [Bifidobacterium sp. B4081]MCX8668968.1 hypothetical protein [Bifidobacterium sp. B3998]MCX8686838.1 hypothetical protein [Bifidobacterium sp. B4142]
MIAGIGVLLLAVTIAGCAPSAVHVSQHDPDNLRPTACEQAWTQARQSERLQKDQADSRAQAWVQTARDCPARLDEATVHAAQALTASQDGEQADRQKNTLRLVQAVQRLDPLAKALPAELADQAITGEDRSGFELSVLAARKTDAAWMLTLADAHTAAAQILVGNAKHDPRQGVYPTTDLLAHPDECTDPVNGIQAPTPALIEMDTARTLLTVGRKLNGSSGTIRTNASQNATSRQEATSALVDVIVAHLSMAMDLGYPATSSALLQTPRR